MQELITILGPTATGKTNLATHLAKEINGEIISADSRQVFRHMDIGTGKDLDEYSIEGLNIPYHLIDIKDPGEEYSLFDFQKDFIKSFNLIRQKQASSILCGGTTLYLDSILSAYRMVDVPDDFQMPEHYKNKDLNELESVLKELKPLHNTTDLKDRNRLENALRNELFAKESPDSVLKLPEMNHVVFGIGLPMDVIRDKITKRLKFRLKNGMIQEAERLIEMGVSHEMMSYYGLEYKYLSQFLQKQITFNDLVQKLNSAIHQFAKKQMTKYRSMEKNGIEINWIDGTLDLDSKLNIIREKLT